MPTRPADEKQWYPDFIIPPLRDEKIPQPTVGLLCLPFGAQFDLLYYTLSQLSTHRFDCQFKVFCKSS